MNIALDRTHTLLLLDNGSVKIIRREFPDEEDHVIALDVDAAGLLLRELAQHLIGADVASLAEETELHQHLEVLDRMRQEAASQEARTDNDYWLGRKEALAEAINLLDPHYLRSQAVLEFHRSLERGKEE